MIWKQDLLIPDGGPQQLCLGGSGKVEIINTVQTVLPGDLSDCIVGQEIRPFHSTTGSDVSLDQQPIPAGNENQHGKEQDAGQAGEEGSHQGQL